MTSAPWRKGGMTCSGLKETTQAIDYFYGPGRSNIIPNAYGEGISSIGYVQTNGLKQIASGDTGPGTLLSTNMSVRNPMGINDSQIGVLQSSGNRTNFVDYRSTDPSLVQNLRINPLSIYAVGEKTKDAEIPAFFADVSPDDYANYKRGVDVDISKDIKELYIDGSPNVSILGLQQQNPFMGLGPPKPNQTPHFSGKVYGGQTGNVEHIANAIYNSVGDSCQNKALAQFSQGYNVAPQIVENKMIVEGPQANNNIPWGPLVVTGNPITQQGGVWQNSHNTVEVAHGGIGIQNLNNSVYQAPTKGFVNPYRQGLPGTLIA